MPKKNKTLTNLQLWGNHHIKDNKIPQNIKDKIERNRQLLIQESKELLRSYNSLMHTGGALISQKLNGKKDVMYIK